jgi:hypothetical protein
MLAYTAAVDTKIAPAYIIANDQDNIGFGSVTILSIEHKGRETKRSCESRSHHEITKESTPFHNASGTTPR